jgi:hypothetical protein
MDRPVRHPRFQRLSRHNFHYLAHDRHATNHAPFGRRDGPTQQTSFFAFDCGLRKYARHCAGESPVRNSDTIYVLEERVPPRSWFAIPHLCGTVALDARLSILESVWNELLQNALDDRHSVQEACSLGLCRRSLLLHKRRLCTYTYEPESGETSISRLSFFPIHVHTNGCNR